MTYMAVLIFTFWGPVGVMKPHMESFSLSLQVCTACRQEDLGRSTGDQSPWSCRVSPLPGGSELGV